MKKITLIFFVLLLVACSDNPQPNPISAKEVQEVLLNANIKAAEIEDEQINTYVKEKKLDVIKTGTGLRYVIYHQKDTVKRAAKEGSIAKIEYTVSLLNGTQCYSTAGNPEEFLIGNDDVETGLHEAVTYLKPGDKAIVIIPSHLAHGLAGDFKKIPMRSTIIYDIELISLK